MPDLNEATPPFNSSMIVFNPDREYPLNHTGLDNNSWM
jgi:hypothetical protein